ncbi:MAG: DUF4931 domain-containing protein [archaeon]
MLELRKDYLVDEYVIIATERAKRPEQFKEIIELPSKKETCPFCPGNESQLPVILQEIRYEGKWKARAIPNKFKIVEQTGNPDFHTDNTFFTFASAYGFHEIIIESPHHDEELEQQSVAGITDVLKLARARFREHMSKQNIRSVVLFKNRGKKAGASISHGHMQLLAYNHVSPFLREQLEKFYEFFLNTERCPYCDIAAIEKTSYRRVLDYDHCVAFTPYASRFPFEVWISPKRHVTSFADMNDEECDSLAAALKYILSRLNTLNTPPYNIEFVSATAQEPYHFHVRITPRLTTWGGFELDTMTIVNPVSPEDAAKFYRGEA